MVDPHDGPDPNSDAAVLGRSDRYLREVVEEHNLCPYARPSRENGMIRTQLLRGTDVAAALVTAMAELQRTDPSQFEAALLVAPDYPGTAAEWERLSRDATDQVAANLHAEGLEPSMYAVAFHPDLAYATDSPEKLVGLLRHTPDPTVQLVRRSLVDRIRGTRGEASYLDVSELETPEEALAALEAMHGGISVAQHISRANYATWQRLAGQLERTLAELHAHRPATQDHK